MNKTTINNERQTEASLRLTREANGVTLFVTLLRGLEHISIAATPAVHELETPAGLWVVIKLGEAATTHTFVWRLGAALWRQGG